MEINRCLEINNIPNMIIGNVIVSQHLLISIKFISEEWESNRQHLRRMPGWLAKHVSRVFLGDVNGSCVYSCVGVIIINFKRKEGDKTPSLGLRNSNLTHFRFISQLHWLTKILLRKSLTMETPNWLSTKYC